MEPCGCVIIIFFFISLSAASLTSDPSWSHFGRSQMKLCVLSGSSQQLGHVRRVPWLRHRVELEVMAVASCDCALCQPSVLSATTAAQFAETAQTAGEVSSPNPHRSILRSSQLNRFELVVA